jgi:hypothetical protein
VLTDPTQTITGEAQINGALGAPQPAPQVTDGRVVSAANYTVTALSPGSIVAIFGSQLSDATSVAPVLPLSTQLNNTTVFLGNSQLPLFFTSAGQVNAAVPFETAVNTNLQLLVQRDNTYATPVYVDVASSATTRLHGRIGSPPNHSMRLCATCGSATKISVVGSLSNDPTTKISRSPRPASSA